MIKEYLVERRLHDRRASQAPSSNQTDTLSEPNKDRRTSDRRQHTPSDEMKIFSDGRSLLDYFSQVEVEQHMEVDAEFNERGHVTRIYLH